MAELAFVTSHPVFWAVLGGCAALLVGRTAIRLRALLADRHPDRQTVKERRRTVAETEKILHGVAQHANDGLVYQDINARILWANEAYCRTMGFELDEILGRRPQEFCYPPEARPSDAEIESFRFDPAADEFHQLTRRLNMRKNGERFWHEFNLSLIENDAGEQRVILVSRDVTEQVSREQELERTKAELHHAANHDVLTGLPNR
ncbi:MAG: PAS domain S-box protein, partial [Pseudomonadota bacterium]